MSTQSKETSSTNQGNDSVKSSNGNNIGLQLLLGAVAIGIWYAIYSQLLPFADWFAYSLLDLSEESHLGAAIQFFVYDTPKVLMLLVLVVFFVGILRSFVTVDWTRHVLAGKKSQQETFLLPCLVLSLLFVHAQPSLCLLAS